MKENKRLAFKVIDGISAIAWAITAPFLKFYN